MSVPPQVRAALALVAGYVPCCDSAPSAAKQCAAIVAVLTHQGVPCQLTVCDTFYLDSATEGARLFGVRFDGVVYDHQGRIGWQDIAENDAHSHHPGWEWAFCSYTDEALAIDDEMAQCTAPIRRWLDALPSYMDQHALAAGTPQRATSPARLRL